MDGSILYGVEPPEPIIAGVCLRYLCIDPLAAMMKSAAGQTSSNIVFIFPYKLKYIQILAKPYESERYNFVLVQQLPTEFWGPQVKQTSQGRDALVRGY
jgi:hypothetical protein